MRVLKRLLLVLLLALIAAVALGWVFFDRIVMAALTPTTAFDPARVPAVPNYAAKAPGHWSARADMNDLADVAIEGLTRVHTSATKVDVFYVHPSSYVANGWNGALDDAVVNRATDRGATRIQASAFNGCCAIYAPRYRQANLTAFTHPSASGALAIKLAGDDVVAAFKQYLEHDNRGRPFILAGHSQGSIHAMRLLREVIVDDVRARMVAAYLIGAAITDTDLKAANVPACATPTATGCVVGYNARSRDYAGGMDQPVSPESAGVRVCVNPLTWLNDDARGTREQHKGSVFFGGDGFDDPIRGRSVGSARCVHGTLVVELLESPPRDFMSRLLDHALGDGNFHPIEYGLFFVDIRDNAAARIAAFK